MFLSRLFADATSPSLSSGGWRGATWGAGRSEAGPRVTPQTALALTAVQACVTLLAEAVAQLPLAIYRKQSSSESEAREVAEDHPLHILLHDQPNGWQSAFEYREQCQTALGLRGNSYSWIERDGRGRVVALYPLDPDQITVLRGPDGRPYYAIGSTEPVPQRLIHHVRWITLNGYTGVSPIALHKDALGIALAIEKHTGQSFVNGTALSGVIERPAATPAIKDQETIDRILAQWQAKFGGVDNARKVALLQEGMTFSPLSMSNVDAELIASRKLSAVDIARIYKVPAHLVNELDRATFSNIEHQAIQFVIYTLLPWLKRHEQAMRRDLLTPEERRTHSIEFNVCGLLRGDQKSRFEAYAMGRQWGWLSVNDIRRLENLPPITGGDTYLQPLNMSAVGHEPTSPGNTF